MPNIIMTPGSIEVSYITISLSSGIDDLVKDNFKVSLNNTVFNEFNLEKINVDGTLYKIIPYNPFSIYDEVRIEINKSNYSINALNIYISKYFYNSGAIFLYNVPQIASGVYGLNLTKINDVDFLLASDPITICNGVNKDLSYLETDKPVYSLGETINLTINLLDEANLKVPDGKYVIKIKLEKL